MVAHFTFDKDKREAIIEIKEILENNGYIIEHFAPEDAFLFTDYKLHDWGTGRRLLAIAIHITDKVTLTGIGSKMDIPIGNLGPTDKLLELKTMDEFSYQIQKKTFYKVVKMLDSSGYSAIKHSP